MCYGLIFRPMYLISSECCINVKCVIVKQVSEVTQIDTENLQFAKVCDFSTSVFAANCSMFRMIWWQHDGSDWVMSLKTWFLITHTVVQEWCNVDDASQWWSLECVTSLLQNPSTDRHQSLYTWMHLPVSRILHIFYFRYDSRHLRHQSYLVHTMLLCNSLDINPVDYKFWAVLQESVYQISISDVIRLKQCLTTTWTGMQQQVLDEAVEWCTWLQAYIEACEWLRHLL